MLMWYHWGHSPGHLYMYKGWPFQLTGSTHQRDSSRVDDITWAQDNSDSTINEQIIGYNKSVQMGSDSDDANSDINADVDSDHGGVKGVLMMMMTMIGKCGQHMKTD